MIPDLLPAVGDADQAGGPDLLQAREERLVRGIAGEDVRPAPEQHPHHLEVAPEGVEERQVG